MIEIDETEAKIKKDLAKAEKEQKERTQNIVRLNRELHKLQYDRVKKVRSVYIGRAFEDTSGGGICIVKRWDDECGGLYAVIFFVQTKDIRTGDIGECIIHPAELGGRYKEIPMETFLVKRDAFLEKLFVYLKGVDKDDDGTHTTTNT